MATEQPSLNSVDSSIILLTQKKSIPYYGEMFSRLPLIALDTCALADITMPHAYRLGLVGGVTVIRQSIVWEVDRLGDSPDPKKRYAAQRAVAMLAELPTFPLVAVHIDPEEPLDHHPDNDLLLWAEAVRGQIFTADTELQRRAREKGITVITTQEIRRQLQYLAWTLNQHFQLLRSIKRGDVLSVLIEKVGKKEGQGIAYLDDGRMVVIDQGAAHRGDVCTVYVQRTHKNGGSVEIIFATLDPSDTLH